MEKTKLLVKLTYRDSGIVESKPLIALKKMGITSRKPIMEAIVKEMGHFDGDNAAKLDNLVYQLSNGNYCDLGKDYRFVLWNLNVY